MPGGRPTRTSAEVRKGRPTKKIAWTGHKRFPLSPAFCQNRHGQFGRQRCPRLTKMQLRVLAFVLAGGKGTRLYPLTKERAKPAVPFGGRYRIVDFVLSNLANSGVLKIKVLTQYKSDSLNVHISRGWRLSSLLGHYVEAVPAQQRMGRDWFKG